MFIKRKEYEELKESVEKAFDLEIKVKELEANLSKYESNKHQCDELCKGCQHLVEYVAYPPYSTCVHTAMKCALDRECKDYKSKETQESEE